jgi:hypothetical protein
VRRVSTPLDSTVIVGAGASTLVGALVDEGYRDITCVDIAQSALDTLDAQLGDRAEHVRLVCRNVIEIELDEPVALWHDRATFHFLTDAADQCAYVATAARSVAAGGSVILATFAPDGPTQCSGLDIAQWSSDDLGQLFNDSFDLVDHFEHTHITPWGSEQRFTYVVLTRR